MLLFIVDMIIYLVFAYMTFLFRISTCFIFYIIFSFQLAAQENEVWSLERCIQYAKDHNLQLRQLDISRRSAELDVVQSKNARLPNVNGNTNLSTNFGRSLNPTTYSFETSNIVSNSINVSASVPLYNGGRIKNSIEQNRLIAQSRQWDGSKAFNDLATNIAAAYLAVVQAEQQISIVQHQADNTLQQLERTQKLIRSGTIPAGDSLQIEAQIANDQLTLVQARTAADNAYLNLSQLLNYFKPFRIEIPAVAVPETALLKNMQPQNIYEDALRRMPEIKAADLNVQASQKGIDLAKAGKLPSVSLFSGFGSNYASIARELINSEKQTAIIPIGFVGSIGGTPVFTQTEIPISTDTRRTPYFKQFSNNFNYNIGVSLAVPIFDAYNTRTNVSRARLNIENSEIQLENAKNQLYNNIEVAYRQAVAAAAQYEATQKSIAATQLALANIEKRFQVGAATVFDYNNAKNQLSIAEINQNTAKYEYIFRMKILDFYAGKALAF